MLEKILKDDVETEEFVTGLGTLTVITGGSGVGKDAVVDEVVKHPEIRSRNMQKVITCTTRGPREGEICDVHYHFISEQKMIEMYKNGELVEEMTLTGSSYKATPRSEIERVLKGEHIIWRIDPSRAAEVASGAFFTKHFPEHAVILQRNTMVVCVTAPNEVIEAHRRKRDGDRYSPEEYRARDEQELPHLNILRECATLVENVDGKLEETVSTTVGLVIRHYEKAKVSKSNIVLVGGCFDILHYGHIQFLKKAKALGNYLIVLLESDENIKRLKGENRPIFGQNERREMLLSLKFVDEVIILSESMKDEDYRKLVKDIKPNFIAITEGDPIIEKKRKQAESVGAKLVEIPRLAAPSTSQILKILKIE